jgi:hypothetical protein
MNQLAHFIESASPIRYSTLSQRTDQFTLDTYESASTVHFIESATAINQVEETYSPLASKSFLVRCGDAVEYIQALGVVG